jgi:transposase
VPVGKIDAAAKGEEEMSYIRRRKRKGRVYLEEVESKRIGDKVVQEHIRYIGKEADGRTILSASVSDVEIEQVKVHGPLIVLHHLAKEIKLDECLGPFADELLSMVYAHCMDYQSVNQMARWYERTDLNMILSLEELTEARLLEAMDYLEKRDPVALQIEIFENVSDRYDLRRRGIVYDVTNTYLYGKKCPLGKQGKDKEGVKGRPLIQIGLGVTQDEGIPLFHKVFNGDIHDARTFQDAITAFREYKIKKGLVVFDRGISSRRNQIDIKTLQWKVLCGLPLNDALKRSLRDLMAKEEFLHYRNRVRSNKTVFYVITEPYSLCGITGKLAFCFNDRLRRDIRESRYDEIAYAQELLQDGKVIKPGMEKFFGSDGRLLMGRVQKAEEFDGYSCIFTTARLSKEEMVRLYFEKDLVEKAFQSLKGVIKLRPIRHWLYNRVTAHVFICYLSYLLLSLLRLRLKKMNISPVEALRELESVYKVYLRDQRKGFKLARVVTLSKKQEKILRALDKRLIPSM